MLHLLRFPYNGEPPKRLVTSKTITPNPVHFARNHGGIPIIGKDKWDLSLDWLVANSLQPRRPYGRVPVPSYREDGHYPVLGYPPYRTNPTIRWPGGRGTSGPIGTARYVGISLKKVIKDCGGLLKPAKHLKLYEAETYIKDLEVGNYVFSVTWSKGQRGHPGLGDY
jgi:sulfite oxidase